jgi:hypothetical protein
MLAVLGTHDVAKDLLEKRGDIYSSRPRKIAACATLIKYLDTDLTTNQERDIIWGHERAYDAIWRQVETVEEGSLRFCVP